MNKPKLRFPEFNEEWEERTLSEIFEFIPTNSFSRANLNYERGHVKNIHYGDIHTKFPTNLDCDSVKIPFINPDIKLDKIRLESYCRDGDLIIADASEDYDDIGKAVELKNVNDRLLAGLHTFLARDKSGLTVDGFRGYIFLNNALKLQIKKIATGISVLGISKNNLGKLKIKIPSINEQGKIAIFLSKVDEKIGFIEKKREYWKSYKKGMMQKIFGQKLRFKDENGEDYPDWEIKEAKEIFNNYSNKNHDGNLPILAVTQDKGVVYRDSIDIHIKSSNKSITSYKLIEPGNFVISLRSFQGGIEYSKIKGISSPAYTVLKPKIGIVDDFYKYYFKKEEFISRLNSAVIGIREGKQISYSVFSEMLLPYPYILEQRKIANYFSIIDLKINQINKELEINKDFKKGLLQQMFC